MRTVSGGRARAVVSAAWPVVSAASAAWGQCGPGWWPAGDADAPVRALLAAEVEGGPRLYAGGEFTAVGGTEARRIASWDGRAWREVGPGLSAQVVSMVVHPYLGAPRLFIGGFFEEGGLAGPGPDGLVWLNGDIWGGTPGGNPMFWTMGLCSFGGELFTSAGVTDYVWRLGPSGWNVPGDGLESVVHAGLTHDDGTGVSLFAGGSFLEGCKRWDGTAWRSVGGGVQGGAYALAVFDDGRGPALYVAGVFARVGVFGGGGVQAMSIARWDGTRWEALGPGLNRPVHALAVFDAGDGPRLYAGGEFTASGSTPIRHLAVWDGSTWSEVAGGTDGVVSALAVFDADGPGPARARLAVGGEFTAAGGSPMAGLAWYGTCAADLSCDGQVDFVDYLEFINLYDSSDLGADLNGDGSVDFADYLEFLNRYDGGC